MAPRTRTSSKAIPSKHVPNPPARGGHAYSPPALPASGGLLRAVIAELQNDDPGGVLKAQLKALLA